MNKVEISTIKYDADDTIKQYAEKKIGHTLKYLPRHAKKSARCHVTLEKLSKKRDDQYQVEVAITVPDKTLTVTSNASTILAAIDIAQPKILSQVRRYKTETVPHIGKRGVFSKLKNKFLNRK